MEKINRKLVKSQARKLIKDKVFLLFIISAVVALLTSSSAFLSVGDAYSVVKNIASGNGNSYYNYYDFDDDDDYEDFYSFSYGSQNPFSDYSSNSAIGQSSPVKLSLSNAQNKLTLNLASLNIGVNLLSLVNLVFTPMLVTLAGYYVSFIRKNPDEDIKLGKDLGDLFKHSFDSTALKKFLCVILRNVFTILLCFLFIIPGIIYAYRTYFAYQIMNDNPNLKPTEALKLSGKMVKGAKTELFVLDLSFIPWYLLMCITCGLAGIYVTPYLETTRALYYENFRLRALATGTLREEDFLSEEELKEKYYDGESTQQGTYYSPEQSGAPNQEEAQQNYYTPPKSDYEQSSYYYTPPQNDDEQNKE